MRSLGTGFKNCRIIIKDALQDVVIADTRITSYDWEKNKVRVNAFMLENTECMDVVVLIFGEDSLYEYLGQLESAKVIDEKAIRLFNGKEKEDRACSRYDLYTHGEIEQIEIMKHKINLHKPIEIKALNISASGILLQSMSESFKEEDEIMANVVLDNRRFKMKCQIVRIQNSGLWTEEYGCRILSMHSI